MRKPSFILSLVLLMFVAYSSLGLACTSIMVGKDASVDGSVMTTHTCDGNYDATVVIVPGEKFEAGTMAPVFQNRMYDSFVGRESVQVGEIPQVEETYTYFHIAYPFMNEHSVIIGEATWMGRRELFNTEAIFMIDELEAFGLQRAKTAREFIQVAGKLAETYGYADGGEALTVADGNEVWLFEIAGPGPFWSPSSGEGGAVWAARRIPDDHIAVIANRARIETLDLSDPDNYMASPNVYSLAEEMGWWTPEEEFVFHKVYNPTPYGSPFYQSRREWRAFDLLAPSLGLDPYAAEYPFSVKPDEKVSPQDLMAIYRDHLQGTEFDLTVGMAAGPFGNPNRYPTPAAVKPEAMKSYDWERAIAMFRCSYSFVGQVRGWLPTEMAGLMWFGEDAPNHTVYVPIYASTTKVPESISSGKRGVFDRDSGWWAFNFVSNYADLRYDLMTEDIAVVQAEFEDKFFAMQPAIEAAALAMYEVNPDLAVEFLTDYTYNAFESVVSRWWKLAEELVGKYTDGYAGNVSPGYPTWWLEEVGYGETMVGY